MSFITAPGQGIGNQIVQPGFAKGAARLFVREDVLQADHLAGQFGQVLLRTVDDGKTFFQMGQALAGFFRALGQAFVEGAINFGGRGHLIFGHGLKAGQKFGLKGGLHLGDGLMGVISPPPKNHNRRPHCDEKRGQAQNQTQRDGGFHEKMGPLKGKSPTTMPNLFRFVKKSVRTPPMTIMPIIIAPDPRLKIKCRPVSAVDEEVRRLMDDMLESMHAANGIGLAAPQVGLDQRIIVVDVSGADDKPNPIYMANPEIVSVSDMDAEREEGCLSLPDQFSTVTRPNAVRVRYLDHENEIRERDVEGLLATCIQHEMDHLDGILFVDHISALKRNMILRKLTKIKRAEAPA